MLDIAIEFGKANPCHNASDGKFCSASGSAASLTAADAAYFDYEEGALIKEASRGTLDVSDRHADGSRLSAEEVEKYKQYASILQREAESSTTPHSTVWRGMYLDETAFSALPKRGIIEFDSLTSASPKREIASIYSNDPLGEGRKPVLFRIERSGGVIGYERKGGGFEVHGASEVLLPRGAKYRVAGTYKESDGTTVYRLYDKGTLNTIAKRDLAFEFTVTKFNPCHTPSGPKGGQFCSGVSNSVYHGTADKFVKSIKLQGLVPKPAVNGKGVYAIGDKATALSYGADKAEDASGFLFGDPRIEELKVALIRIDDPDKAGLRRHVSGIYVSSKKVKPSFISSIEIYRAGDIRSARQNTKWKAEDVLPISTHKISKGTSQEVYFVVALVDADEIFKQNPCHVASGAKGGQFCSTGSSSSVKLKPVKGKAFAGETVETKTKLSKQEAGKLGEDIVVAYLKSHGMKDARPLNAKVSNFPVDLVQDHGAIEVKTGQVSNSKSAQKWRATIGQPGKKETEWLRKASPEAKAAWNQKKMEAILHRKEAALGALGKQLGKKVSGSTMAVIINPDTRRADIFNFKGFHLHIRWSSESTKKAYVGTVSY